MIRKRLTVILLTIALLVSFASSSSLACDEDQTNTYVSQILFGDNAASRASDEKAEMLLAALYLCCEQSGDQGQDKISYLKTRRVAGVPSLSTLKIKDEQLLECSHIKWESEFLPAKKAQANRKKVLRNTVNKVFDFGFVNNVFGSNKGKCDSFAALLYYSHLLSDYLNGDQSDSTKVFVNGKLTPAFHDEPYIIINNNIPNFDLNKKYDIDSPHDYSGFDEYHRAGSVFGIITPNKLQSSSTRANMSGITPSGWSFNKYPGIVNSNPAYLYNRCHLIAHSLGGVDQEKNLVTGTRNMNECMRIKVEDKVLEYVRSTKKTVLYRATPIYKGNNKVCSGVQIEACSLDDKGESIHFNIFFYNAQPKVSINYATGDNYANDVPKLPFVVNNPSESNPDLVYEMDKHLKVLFEDQKDSALYTSMFNEINSVANKARTVKSQLDNSVDSEDELKVYEAKYFDVLKRYVPKLLEKEDFFKKTFK